MRQTPIALAAFAVAALAAPLAQAQIITLNRGFMPDPQRFQGTAGGPVSAQTVQQDCRGFIPAQPSFILQTPTGFNFLRVFADSGSDTTLMVRGVNQTWCNDDSFGGSNPSVDLQGIPPGRYDIYVGTYSSGQAYPYQLSITELRSNRPGGTGSNPVMQPQIPPQIPQVPQFNAQGMVGNLNPSLRAIGRPLTVPPNPIRVTAAMGRTTGEFRASNVQGEGTCTGWMQAAPSHTMVITRPQPFLVVAVTSAADSTLIIRRPDGSVVCNDDHYQFNPGIEGAFPAGLYQIWVGAYRQGELRPYRITVSSNPSAHP